MSGRVRRGDSRRGSYPALGPVGRRDIAGTTVHPTVDRSAVVDCIQSGPMRCSMEVAVRLTTDAVIGCLAVAAAVMPMGGCASEPMIPTGYKTPPTNTAGVEVDHVALICHGALGCASDQATLCHSVLLLTSPPRRQFAIHIAPRKSVQGGAWPSELRFQADGSNITTTPTSPWEDGTMTFEMKPEQLDAIGRARNVVMEIRFGDVWVRFSLDEAERRTIQEFLARHPAANTGG